MKRTIITALVTAALSFGAYAAENSHSLVVNLVSGSSVDYLFVNEPTVTFVDDDIHITDGIASPLQQPIASVVNFTFRSKSTGIDDIAADGQRITVAYDGNEIAIAGLEAGSEVSIYSAAGLLCAKAVADEAGSAVVRVDMLDNGVYVASSKQHNFKFVKK